MPRQLSFDLPRHESLGRADFLPAPANAMALALIDAWPAWPGGKLALTGPAASGKTHLAHIWAARSGAAILPAAALAEADVPGLALHHVAVEDIDRAAGDAAAEAALFHLHNLALAEGRTLLLTGTGPVASWHVALPDLASRLSQATSAAIADPDDALLAGVIAKLFADRQVVPEPDVIPWLVRHTGRSFADARRAVAAIDALCLAEGRAATRPLAMRALDRLAEGRVRR